MTDDVLLDTTEKAFATVCTFEAVQEAQARGWAPEVWEVATSIGLPWIGVPEAAGGAGGTLGDALAVLRIAGAHAAPIPLAETGVLAGWLLAQAGLPIGDGPLTVVPGRREDDLRLDGGRLAGRAHRVPWAAAAARIVALVDGQVVSVAPHRAIIDPATNVAGEPRDTVTFDHVDPDESAPAGSGVDPDTLRYRGALSRVALMAGALEATAAITASYTMQRVQFGKPIGSFQAVQAHVVKAAEEAALVDLAAQVAAREAERHPAHFEIAAAKAVANNAARVATRAAHQAHGAMGMTQAYPLHQLTRRLWAWRAEYGDSTWAARIGQAATTHDPDNLYRVIADGSPSNIAI